MGQSSVSREMLWQAWPSGMLARRGVHTTDLWTCVFAEPDCHGVFKSIWRFGTDNELNVWEDDRCGFMGKCSMMPKGLSAEGLIASGALIPDVDPSNVATWNCCLADLAEAVGCKKPYAVEWCRVPIVPMRGDTEQWRLRWTESSVGQMGLVPDPVRYFDIDTDDPALALVLARVQLREKEGQDG